MIKYSVITIVLICFAATAICQPALQDSLLAKLATIKEDSAGVLLYINLGNTYENSNPETARFYYRKAEQLTKKINYKAGYFKFLSHYSNTCLILGKQDSMLYYNQLGLAAARQAGDSFNTGLFLFNIGIAYREKSDFAKAIEYCTEGRKIIEKSGRKEIEMQMDDALQVLYNNRTEYVKAIGFGEQAASIARELNNRSFLAQVLSNLSMSYVETSAVGKARSILNEVVSTAKDLHDPRIEASALSNLSGIALKERDYAQTLQYVERSLVLYSAIGSKDGEATALRAKAVCLLQQGSLDHALQIGLQALDIDRKNNYKREETAVLRVLSCIYYAKHDATAGIDYDDKSNIILEGMVKDIMSQQSSEIEKKYDTEKKEVQIKELQNEKKIQQLSMHQKNTLNYLLIAGSLILLIISFLSYRNYRQKQKLQQQRISELETQQQLTATEAVLMGEAQERIRLARDLHDGLGGMLSGIKYSMNTMKGNLIMTPDNQQAFERSMDMLDSSIQEMRRVAHNMMPEALVKFGLDTALKDFSNDITQSGALKVNYQSMGMEGIRIEQTTAIAIYRIVQELVNNTIKHAAATTAIVQLTGRNGRLSITVEDDGKGFDTAILQRPDGMGWSNIQNRVDFLKGKLDIQSDQTKGTSVHIEFET